MTKAINTTVAKISILGLIFATAFAFISPVSADISGAEDTMTRSKISTPSSHDITFTLADLNGTDLALDAGDIIVYDFSPSADSAEDFSFDGSIVVGDVGFEFGSGPTAADINGFDAGTSPSATCSADDADDVKIEVDTDDQTITVETCPAWSQSDNEFYLTVGTAAGGTNRITNPSAVSTTEDPIYIGIDFTDADNSNNNINASIGVNIVADDQVIVYGQVEGYMEATLSADTCNLGVIPSSEADPVGGCSYTMDVETNANGGYGVTVVQGGAMTDGVMSISAVSDGTVNAGSDEYGVSTSDTSNNAINTAGGDDIGCTSGSLTTLTSAEDAAPLTSSPQYWMTYTDEALAGSPDTERLCHYAAVDETLQSGEYRHTVTHIANGTF